MIGYLPLPTNTHETINIFGAEIPSFAIYAATANLSVPLVLGDDRIERNQMEAARHLR